MAKQQMTKVELDQMMDNVVKQVLNPEAITELFARKLYMDDSMPCKNWSFLNQMILFYNGTNDARTYKGWQQVGRQVKKGCKAISILVPLIGKVKDKETNEEETRVFGFKASPRFKYEDTEGEELENIKEVMEENSKKEELPLYDIAMSLGLSVEFAPTSGAYEGYYSGKDKKIVLCSNSRQTFFHELAHAIDHKLGNLTLGKGQQADNEIVAELTACFFSSMFGEFMEIEETHSYIKSYCKDKPMYKEINTYMNRCFKIIEYVTDFTNK